MKFKIKVKKSGEGTRIDKFLSLHFPDTSRSSIEKLIKNQSILVNGKFVKKSYLLEDNDIITGEHITQNEQIEPEDMQLKILYEDTYLAVVHKDRNCIIHPTTHIRKKTLVNGLLHEFENLSTIGGTDRPGIVHRLDKDTTGLVIIAKDDHTHLKLKELFKMRLIKKKYLCICHGCTPHNFSINRPIGRDPNQPIRRTIIDNGKSAMTYCNTVDSNTEYSLLDIDLITGRTHQIRVHLSSLHHPILGDPLYGRKKEKIKADYPLLHSYFLGFKHPITGKKIQVTDPIDQYFSQYLLKTNLKLSLNFFNEK